MTKQARGNADASANKIAWHTADETMAAFDALPPPIRAWVREARLSWSPIEILSLYRNAVTQWGKGAATDWFLRFAEASQQEEFEAFAAQYQRQTGLPYPAQLPRS